MALIAALLNMFGIATHAQAEENKPLKWVVYYTEGLPAEDFKSYDLIVFDKEHHPSLEPLKFQGKTLLGYISGGEAEDYRPYFKFLKENNLLLKENSDWAGHFIIDIRKPEWTRYVIEKIIPEILQQGFNGIMIDTLDSPIALEAKDPKTYAGMKDASANFVKAIRYHYPNLKIMVNRGFDILPQIESNIDYLLAESIYVSYNFKDKSFGFFPPEVYKYHVDWFTDMKKRLPNLTVVTLDYWDMKDEKGIKAIYDTQRKNGFAPYVSSLDLQTIYPEPAQ